MVKNAILQAAFLTVSQFKNLRLGLLLCLVGCAQQAPVDSSPEAIRQSVLAVRELHRQAQALPELREFGRAAFLEADKTFDQGVLAAREGRMTESNRYLKIASRLYREATLDTLENGPVQTVRNELNTADEPASAANRELAQQQLAVATKLIEDSRGAEFQIIAIADTVYAKLAWALELLNAPTEVAGEFPCLTPVDAEIFAFEVTAPAPGALLNHAPIYYLEGDSLDVSVRVPACTTVSDVTLVLSDLPGGTVQLGTDGTAYDPIEGTSNIPYYYDNVRSRSEPNGQRTNFLRLHFPDFDDGRSIAVRISIGSVVPGNALEDELAFTVALVKRVGGVQRFGMGGTEIRNGFVRNTYQRFGDIARDKDDNPGTDHGELYNPAYKALALQIDEDGVHYQWRVKSDVEDFCDPTIKIDGIFNLQKVANSLDVVWNDDGPEVNIDFPW